MKEYKRYFEKLGVNLILDSSHEFQKSLQDKKLLEKEAERL